MIERQHRVGLAAAEIGLQLDDRVASLAGQSQHGLRQQPAQALGQEGPAEELGRVLVLVRSLSLINLPEVGGELGLLVAAGGHVRVRGDDFPPRLQGRRAVCPRSAGTDFLRISWRRCSSNMVRIRSMRIWPTSVAGFGGRDGVEQPLHRIERPDGVVAAELLVVRPAVANVPQLADEAPLGMAQAYS